MCQQYLLYTLHSSLLGTYVVLGLIPLKVQLHHGRHVLFLPIPQGILRIVWPLQ